jgi:hypothetical protein
MKDYETMAESVLKRRDIYMAKRRRQIKSISVVSGICLVVLVSVGVWRSGIWSNPDETATGGEYVSHSAKEELQQNTEADCSDAVSDYVMSELQQDAEAGMINNSDGDEVEYNVTTMISDFGEIKMESDISVNNGAVVFSDALTGALEQYGTDAGYRVIVELFSDGIEIDCACAEGKAEMERFAAAGYTVAFETYNDGYVDHNYFTLLATAEQLDSNRFPASEQFGYCVLLYGERMEGNGSSQEDMIIAGDFAGECN